MQQRTDSKIRVLIADDHAVVRDGIRRILEDERDIEVVGEAKDGEEAIRKVLQEKPDVVIMDFTMPGVTGLDATRRIRSATESVQILGLTVHESQEYFFSMLEAGAAGYLLKKDATSSELMEAIRSVHRDGVYMHPTVAKWLIKDRLGDLKRTPADQTVTGLTPREEEILKLVADGLLNKDIAEKLHLSPATVQTHRANLMQKLNLHSRAELVKYALRRGLIQLEQ